MIMMGLILSVRKTYKNICFRLSKKAGSCKNEPAFLYMLLNVAN